MSFGGRGRDGARRRGLRRAGLGRGFLATESIATGLSRSGDCRAPRPRLQRGEGGSARSHLLKDPTPEELDEGGIVVDDEDSAETYRSIVVADHGTYAGHDMTGPGPGGTPEIFFLRRGRFVTSGRN